MPWANSRPVSAFSRAKDAAWANIAYRVSHELSDRDRQILMDMANVYLERRRAEKAKEGKS